MKTYRQRLAFIFLFMGTVFVVLGLAKVPGTAWAMWYTMGMCCVGFGIGSLIQRRKAK